MPESVQISLIRRAAFTSYNCYRCQAVGTTYHWLKRGRKIFKI